MTFADGGVELGLLDVDRNARERPVLSAVVEMQVAVDDREHRSGSELRRGEGLADIADARPVVLLDPGVAFTNARVDEDDAVGMADREREDRAVLPGEWMRLWICDVGEMKRDDVLGCHEHFIVHRPPSIRLEVSLATEPLV